MDIKNHKEKRYIMALYYKQHNKLDRSIEQMYRRWKMLWPMDFPVSEPDEKFAKDYEWIIKTIQNKKMKQIISERRKYGHSGQPVARGLQNFAQQNGYFIKRGNCIKYPFNLTGYAIFRLRDGQLVCGKRFNLSYGEAYGYIQRQAEKKEKSNGNV